MRERDKVIALILSGANVGGKKLVPHTFPSPVLSVSGSKGIISARNGHPHGARSPKKTGSDQQSQYSKHADKYASIFIKSASAKRRKIFSLHIIYQGVTLSL